MATTAELQVVLKAKDEASAILKKVAGQTSDLGKSGAEANKGLASMSAGFKAVGTAAAAGLTVAAAGVAGVVAALTPAISAAVGFEQSMSAIKAVSGATAPQLQQLSKLALDLGKSTSFSASEAASGIEELVKGGVSVGDVFGGAASAALDLAAAGGVSVAEAATIASNALNQFNLTGADMANVANKVAGAANASSISVSDFNYSLAAVGAVAATAGQSFDSTATAIALMGAQGIKGSDAGTSLKAVINNLIPTTDKATAKMEELGIITETGANRFIDASGKMKGFGEIAEILQTQTAGLTEAQRLLALELLFGSDGMRAAGVLAKQGGEGFDEMAASMTAAGSAAEIARERLDNAAGDIEQLKGSLETAAITVGSVFLPAVRQIAQTATSAVNRAVDEFDTLRESAANIAGAHGIGMIPAALTAVELRIGETLGAGAQRVFHEARRAVEELADAFETTARSAAVLASMLADRMRPGLEGVRTAAQGAAPVVEALGDAFEATGDAVEPLTRQFANFLAEQGLVSAATAKLSGQQREAAATTDLLFALYRNTPLGAVHVAFNELSAAIQRAQTVTGEAATATDRAWQGFIAGAGAVRDGVAAKLEELAAFIASLPGRFQADAVATGAALVQGMVQGLNPGALIQAATQMVVDAIAGARGQAGGATAVGNAIVQGMAAGILGGAPAVVQAAAGVAQRAVAAAKAALGIASPSKVFAEIGEQVDEGFVAGVEGMAPAVEDAVDGLMDGAAEVATASFADLARALGAAAPAALAPVERAEQEFREKREDAERKHQRRMADLEADLGRARGDARKDVQKRIEAEEADFNRRLEDLARDRGDRVVDLEREQARSRADAVRDLQRGVEDVERTLNEGLAANARKAGEAVSEAMRDAADAIIETRDRTAEAIADLQANQTLDRDIRAAREAFAAGQDESDRERDRAQEDADAAYRLQRDLEKAKLKLGKDRRKAETEEERRQADVRYAEEVESLREGFEEAKKDLARRRQIEDADRAYRRDQQKALQAFNDRLEDEALARQVKRLTEERDERIAQIQAALDEKIKRVRENEAEENEELRRSAREKLDDLRTRFYDKIGDLNEESKRTFEALFASVTDGIEGAVKAANDLAAAIAKAAGVKAPSGGQSGPGLADAATWANQPQSVRDSFTAAYGGDAQRRWEAEHAAELAAAASTANVPPPTGRDPTSGLPTGPGYFEPVPDDPYWQENWSRFNPLPYGTEYPPMAFYGSDSTSRDVFGGNNTYSSDAYATGGVVPGPTGAARLATVHGGEAVFTPDQLAALARYGYGEGGGDAAYWQHSHDIVLDGRVIGRAVEPYVTGAQGRAARVTLG